MAQHNLEGVHRVKKRLAGGLIVEYHYAYRGGPMFWNTKSTFKVGSIDYVQALAKCAETKDKGKFRDIIRKYLKSPDFNNLGNRTQSDIKKTIFSPKGIDECFWDAPIGAFNRPAIRTIALSWRDKSSGRQADMKYAHLRRIISWSVGRNLIEANHLKGVPDVYSSNRADIIWTQHEIDTFCSPPVPEYVQRILIVASETGLAPVDMLKLSRSHISPTLKGRRITMRRSKTNRLASIPVTEKMANVIDTTPSDRLLILAPMRGQAWAHEDQLGKVVHKWRDEIKLRKEIKLYDARGTAATRLLRAGLTLAQLSSHMGWSIETTARMIEIYATLDPDATDDILVQLETAKPRTKL